MKILFDMNNLSMRLIHLPMIEAATSPKWEFWKYLMFQNIYEFSINAALPDDPNEEVRAEIILACDTKEGSWRNDVYPPYKGNRKKDEKIDWEQVFAEYDAFMADIAAFLPWYVLKQTGAEADDIIATIVQNAGDEKCIIHSGDADYLQLVSDTVDVFAPHKDEYVSFPCEVKIANTKVFCETAEEFTLYSVLTGQGRKDNVFNVKTPTDWVPTENSKRMTPFGVKAAAKVISEGVDTAMEKMGCVDNFERNRLLIDFNYIPEEVRKRILDAYSQYEVASPDLRAFLDKYSWPSLENDFDSMRDVICILAGFEVVREEYFEDTLGEDTSEEFEEDFVL